MQEFKKINDLMHNLKKEHPVENTAGQSPAKIIPTDNKVIENLEPECIAGHFHAKNQATSTHSSSTEEVFIPPHSANNSVHTQTSKSEDIKLSRLCESDSGCEAEDFRNLCSC